MLGKRKYYEFNSEKLCEVLILSESNLNKIALSHGIGQKNMN